MTGSSGFALDSGNERRAMGICTLYFCVFGNELNKMLAREWRQENTNNSFEELCSKDRGSGRIKR